MELPRKLIDQVKQDEARVEKIKNKIKATHEYRRRKLDKDVRNYCKSNRILRSSAIDAIGRRHKFHVGATLFREDPAPREDA